MSPALDKGRPPCYTEVFPAVPGRGMRPSLRHVHSREILQPSGISPAGKAPRALLHFREMPFPGLYSIPLISAAGTYSFTISR